MIRCVGLFVTSLVIASSAASAKAAGDARHHAIVERHGGWMARDANPNHAWMYVASGTESIIAIYDLEHRFGPHKIGEITQGLTNPSGLAVDAKGALYATNYDNGNAGGGVSIYPPGATSPSLTLSQGLSVPLDVAVDDIGNVWVVNRGSAPSIVVYPPGQTTPSQVITSSLIQVPTQIIFDSAQDVYFGDNLMGVSEIPAGSSVPVSLNLQKLTATSGIALDPTNGDLFVSTDGPQKILVYPAGQTQPSRTLKLSATACFLANGVIRNREFVFVPDCGSTGNIWVFNSNKNSPLETWNLPAAGGACCIAFKPAGVP